MDELEILLHLKRKYSKDEEVKFLVLATQQQLTEAHIKIGEQKSQIDELEYLLVEIKALYNQQVSEMNSCKANNAILKIDNKKLRNGEETKQTREAMQKKDETIKKLNNTIGTLISKLAKQSDGA